MADIWSARNGDGVERPIEKILSEGQTLLVQVVKDPIGTKGARLSTQVSIAGRLLVYLPQDPHIGISQRIEDEAEREHLRKPHQRAAAGRRDRRLHRAHRGRDRDRRRAARRHRVPAHAVEQIQLAAQTAAPQALLYQDLSLATRVLRDFVTRHHRAHPRRLARDLPRACRSSRSATRARRCRSSSTTPASGRCSTSSASRTRSSSALARRVDLKSGGYLIIDQTEALTTIDVNTGGFVRGRTFDDTIFKTNLEAAQAIARQLRLRNLGGIIIVDFIDMDSQEHRDAVLAEFRKALARDRTRITVNGFSQLGLVEMTRKRTRESLAHVLCEPCPICEGRGELKTAQTICYEMLREILRADRQFNAKEYRILASQKVIDLFLDEESTSLTELGDFIGKPISMQVETAYNQEQYDVILV